MFIALRALALLALCPAAAADKTLDRGADSRAAVAALRAYVAAVPESTARRQTLPLLESLDRRAAELEPEKREAFITGNLADLTAAADRLSPSAAPKEMLKRLQNGAAYLNNRANRFEDARRLADKVLAVDPQDRDALINRSNSNYGLKNFQDALDDATRAAKLDLNDADAYTARALASWGLGDYLNTVEDARRALAVNPNDRTAHALMRLAEGRVPRTAIRDEKTRLEVEVQREYQGMLTQINQAQELSQDPLPEPVPASVQRLIRNAAGKIALKDYHGAIDDAQRALSEDPNNTAAYYYLAAAYNLIGRYESAADKASQALSINPREIAARDARSFAYNHMGRFHDALADANFSLELDPKNPYAYVNRGFAHEKIGDADSMLRDLKKASELNAQFEPVYRDAAASYGLPAPLASGRPPAAPGSAAAAPKRRLFAVVLLSSLVGGVLIALGLLHVFGGRLARPRPPAAVPSFRDDNARSAIDASYAIGKTIGQGGMGVVYEAFDRALGRKVAVKMLLGEHQLDAKAKEQFLVEARTVAALHHPNIVEIHSIVSNDKGLYLVFEFLEGRTVHELIAAKKRLPLSELKPVIRAVCSALDAAHRHGVVHRDLKPANIMITDQGLVKVMDFGISRRIRKTASERPRPGRDCAVTNSVVGTPYYMAPEQEYGIVRSESDVYSLGVCLYEMATGRLPFPPPANLEQKLAESYPRASSLEPCLPRSLDMLIAGALRPDPDKRIRSAADFWAMLEPMPEGAADIAPS
ncbi:MAG: protein kinase [Elusimicrobia bacterium]|nr:protein kinase [Elusimicrobiota bacterium]